MPDRTVPVPPDDDGSADPRVADVLAAYRSGRAARAEVLDALAASRLLVPVVAVLDEAGEPEAGGAGAGGAGAGGAGAGGAGAHRTDKASHMASVSTTGRDGRRGQLAFTCVSSMRRWDPAARPVPVATRAAAEAALADGADALVVDLAGPVLVELDRATLRALAAGWLPLDDQGGAVRWTVPVAVAQPSDGVAAPRRRSRWFRSGRTTPRDGAGPGR